jgi:hypothetical protein
MITSVELVVWIMLSQIRLQEYLRFQAHHHHEVIAAPPFPLFLHATDTSSAASYALPDASGSSNDLQESFVRLQTIFAERDRLPTLRFIEEGFPQFLPLLSSLLDGLSESGYRS